MNVELLSDSWDWKAVSRQIELEGDTLGSGVKLDFRSKFVPVKVLEAIGLQVTDKIPSLFVTRWFDGTWHPQEFLGCRVMGMMNENLGMRVGTGYGGHFGHVEGIWTKGLSNLLQEMGVRNFVTLGTFGGKVASCQAGVPFPGLFCLLEGIPCRLAEWLVKPQGLLESHVVGVVVSRPPWPYENSAERASVGGVGPSLLKHFWSAGLGNHRKGYYVDDTLVGVSTGWAKNFGEANARALVSCRALDLPGKQFRTDLGAELRMNFNHLSAPEGSFLPR